MTTATRDKYDEAIDWLVENADDDELLEGYGSVVERAWDGDLDQGWCLFQIVSPSGLAWKACGCLTQIRRPENTLDACTPELTAAIRADERIPFDVCGMKKLRGDDLRAALLPFAEWQRRLDREIRS